MYRIVKRIVHTVTTVTWMVRWEGEEPVEQQITFPPTHSIVEENVADMDTKGAELSSKPILDEGDKR